AARARRRHRRRRARLARRHEPGPGPADRGRPRRARPAGRTPARDRAQEPRAAAVLPRPPAGRAGRRRAGRRLRPDHGAAPGEVAGGGGVHAAGGRGDGRWGRGRLGGAAARGARVRRPRRGRGRDVPRRRRASVGRAADGDRAADADPDPRRGDHARGPGRRPVPARGRRLRAPVPRGLHAHGVGRAARRADAVDPRGAAGGDRRGPGRRQARGGDGGRRAGGARRARAARVLAPGTARRLRDRPRLPADLDRQPPDQGDGRARAPGGDDVPPPQRGAGARRGPLRRARRPGPGDRDRRRAAHAALPRPPGDRVTFDLVLAGGTVVDGTGHPGYRADVGVSGETIAAIGDLGRAEARRAIDATGLVVAPGFIDPHTHAEGALLTDPQLAMALRQGITTLFLGIDGMSYAPLSAAGYRVYRRWRARRLVGEGLEQGAVGLSTGSKYYPGPWGDTDELIALCEPVRRAGAVYMCEPRSANLDRARGGSGVAEALEVARRAGVRLHFAHYRTAP